MTLWVPTPQKIQVEPAQTGSSVGLSHRERRVVWIQGRMENSTLRAWHMGWFLGCVQLQHSAPFPTAAWSASTWHPGGWQIIRGLGLRPRCGGMRGRGACPLL